MDACKSIIKYYFDFLKLYIEERNSKIIDKKDSEEETLNVLIVFFKKLIKKDITDFSITLNNYVLYTMIKFIKLLIECQLIGPLELIMHEYCKIYLENRKYIDKDEAVGNLFKIFIFAYRKKDFELFKKINNMNIGLLRNIALTSIEDDENTFLFKYYVSILIELLEKNDEYYKYAFNEFRIYLISDTFPKNNRYVIVGLNFLIGNEKFKKSEEIKKDFYELVLQLLDNNDILNESFFINFIYHYTNSGLENDINKIIYIKYKSILNLLETNVEIPMFLYPDYSFIVEENINLNEKNISNARDIEILINKSIINKKIVSLRYLLQILKKILLKYEKSNKQEQIIWLDIYFNILSDKFLIDNYEIFEIIMYYFRETIYKLDKEKLISKDLAAHIIKAIQTFAQVYTINNEKITSYLIRLLEDFLDRENNLNFVYTNTEVEKEIYEILYYIGIDAIEANKEALVRKISNLLGWKLKEKIEKKSYLSNNIIDNVTTLYDLCFVNGLSEQVIIFVGTLFIIIGAFCETNQNYHSYKKRIKDKISKPKYKDYLFKSKLIRECKANEWNELLKSNSNKYFNTFWSYLFKENN